MIWLILWERLQTRLCLKRRYCRGNWQHKSEKRYRHLFRHRTCGFFSKSLCNRISTWCAKFENMMHVGAVWKCWILVQKRSKYLISFAELIYFSETFSILCFAEILCSESGLLNSLDHNIMAPQNFDPKCHIPKKVLKICWLKVISLVLQ